MNEELARLLPKAERVIIPKAGHGSARENPQAFNEAVLKFLASHRPESGDVDQQQRHNKSLNRTRNKLASHQLG